MFRRRNSITPLLAAGLLTTLGLGGCATKNQPPLPTVARVDLGRYSGKWFEVARLQNRFQRDDERAMAEYTPLSPTSVRVRNVAIAPSGKTREIQGTASVVDGSGGARLRVKFEGFAGLAPVSREGNYWIIALDPGYRSVMVGTPDRKYLWILSRSPQLDQRTLRRYLGRARELGFPSEPLIFAPRNVPAG